MSAPASVLKTMSGEAVLRIVRDCLANESARIRSDQERWVAEGWQTRVDPGRLAVILSLNAAVDIVTALIARGQDAKMQKDSLPRTVKLELISVLANEARAALVTEWGETADDEAAHQGGIDDDEAAE
jgi:hypothetical protein